MRIPGLLPRQSIFLSITNTDEDGLMAYTLEQLATDIRDLLTTDPRPTKRAP